MYVYSYLGVVSVFAVVCKAEKNIDFSFPALFANWVDESFIFEKFIKLNDMEVEGNLGSYLNIYIVVKMLHYDHLSYNGWIESSPLIWCCMWLVLWNEHVNCV